MEGGFIGIAGRGRKPRHSGSSWTFFG